SSTDQQSTIVRSKIELNRQPHEARAQERGGLPPLLDNRGRGIVNRVEVVLVRQHLLLVEQVVDIDTDVEALAAEPEVLPELQVEDGVTGAVQLTRIEHVDRIARRRNGGAHRREASDLASRRAGWARLRRASCAARFPRHLVLGEGMVRGALGAVPPLEHRAYENVAPLTSRQNRVS